MLFLLDIFYPLLDLAPDVDPQQEFVLRLLGSLVYHGDSGSFWFLVVIDLVVLLIISVFILSFEPTQYSSFLKFLFVSKILAAYFFWLIASNPNGIVGGCRICFLVNYLYYMIYYILILIVVSLGCAQVSKMIRLKQQEKMAQETIPEIEVTCPHCHALYHSSVSFCLNCNQNINLSN
jgi:hypothetical protein